MLTTHLLRKLLLSPNFPLSAMLSLLVVVVVVVVDWKIATKVSVSWKATSLKIKTPFHTVKRAVLTRRRETIRNIAWHPRVQVLPQH